MTEWLIFLFVGTLWGGSYLAIQESVQVLAPFQAAFIRILIAFLTLLPLIIIKKKSFMAPKALRWRVWIVGLFSNGIPFTFLFWGETKVSAAIGGMINGSVPIWTMLIGALFFPQLEKLNRYKIAGIMVGLVGISLLYLPKLGVGSSSAINHDYSQLWGIIAITCMAISYGIGVILNKRIFAANNSSGDKLDLVTNLFQQMLSSLIYLGILMICTEGLPHLDQLLQPKAAWSLIYLGVFSSALAFLLFYHLIQRWGALSASSVTYMVPIMTLLLNFCFYREIPAYLELFGTVLILSGVALARRS